MKKHIIVIGGLVVFVAFIAFLSTRRIHRPFTILDGRGVSGFIMLDENPLWTYIANICSLRFIWHTREIVDHSNGFARYNLTWPQITVCLNPEEYNKYTYSPINASFEGYSPRLGVVDKNLKVKDVVAVYGELPLVDQKENPFPGIFNWLVWRRFEVAFRRFDLSNEVYIVDRQYRHCGISFTSHGEKITKILIHEPQYCDMTQVLSLGRFGLSSKEVELGRIPCDSNAQFLTIGIKNDTGECVDMTLESSCTQNIPVVLGATWLNSGEMTAIALPMPKNGNERSFQFAFRINFASKREGGLPPGEMPEVTSMCIKGEIRGQEGPQ